MKIPEDSGKLIGQLRRTQLITTFGPGSLVDMPDCSVIVSDASMWEFEKSVLHDERLERFLGVKYFREPLSSEDPHTGKGVIKSFRFPEWCYCPNCHRLAPAYKLQGKRKGYCGKCKENNRLVPSTFVIACENGHIEDFPYRWWVHQNSEAECDDRAPLEITFNQEKGGLEGIVIKCQKCGAQRSMSGSIGADALKGFKCHGRRPWLGRRKDDPIECDKQVRTLQKGSSSLYFPITVGALTLPALDLGPLTRAASENWGAASVAWPMFDDSMKLQYCKSLLEKEGLADQYSPDLLMAEFEKLAAGDETTENTLSEDEYAALTSPDTDDRAFKTVHVGAPESLAEYLDDVVLVKRLREVLALRGFRRVTPEPAEIKGEAEDHYKKRLEEEFTPSTTSKDWLPAMELLGEGLFITLRSDSVDRWVQRIGSRYESMGRHLEQSSVRCDNFSPKFVLLHTLSHLLIRQLTFDCGYSSASIREKIYCSKPGDEQDMCGILLYTSSSDSDGSLGGLVRQGRPHNLEHTFENMLNSASWCSSDPICSQSKDQGFDALNYAACHACTLLPETSCTMRNSLLDRVAVVGEIGNPELGFFGSWFD
jgi:hypothetical protein